MPKPERLVLVAPRNARTHCRAGGDHVIGRDAILGIGDNGRPIHRGAFGRRPRNLCAKASAIAANELDVLGHRQARGRRKPRRWNREATTAGGRSARHVDSPLERGHRRVHDGLVARQRAGILIVHPLADDGGRIVHQRDVAKREAAEKFRERPCTVVASCRTQREATLHLGEEAARDTVDLTTDRIEPELLAVAGVPRRVEVRCARERGVRVEAVVGETRVVHEREHARHALEARSAAVHTRGPALVVRTKQCLGVVGRTQYALGVTRVRVDHRELLIARTETHRRAERGEWNQFLEVHGGGGS